MIGLFTHGLLHDDCSQLDTAKRINDKTKKTTKKPTIKVRRVILLVSKFVSKFKFILRRQWTIPL